MKRGKCEEKTLGPMFPRLHVNDTERGGPRGPPRNKMALYEQLTIPSNRYDPGNMHVNPNSGGSLVPTGTPSKGTSRERSMYFPLYQPPLTPPLPSHSADTLPRHASDVVNLRSPTSQVEQRRKSEEEDVFAVPIFSHPRKEQCNGPKQRSNDEKRRQPPNACSKDTDQVNCENTNLMQDRQVQDSEHTTVFVACSDPTIKYSAEILAREPSDRALQSQHDGLMNGHPDTNRTSRLKCSNVDSICSDFSCGTRKEAERISSRPKSNSYLGLSGRNEFDCNDDGNKRYHTLPRENMDRHADASQISMVATISGSDISPDDVVGVLGLKRFWKAQKAIVNQQRVFAVQVFELHRLVKVQKLIAESPEILLEASAFLGRSSIKATPSRKIPSSCAVKVVADPDKQNDDCQKPNHSDKMEATAENTVAKAPSASPPPTPQPLSHQPFPVNPVSGSQATALEQPPVSAPPVATDSKVSPWPFSPPGGNQWLVPVMSPSEGLIYKPYLGPGFAGPVFGGCGPHGTTPLVGHFINPSYGVPPSHYYHHHHGVPFNIQGYFPAYGMPMMNSSMSGSAVDQINQLSGSNPNGGTGQTVSGMPNFSMQRQGSCNIPSQKHSELLGSTGSSPSERAQDIVGACHATKEKDALTPFSAAPMPGTFGLTRPRKTDQPTAIKVVPHNARTATESAARIFRFIQEERRQHQSD